jgi:hypothetical protein
MANWKMSRLGESYTLRLSRTLTLVVVREMQSRSDPSPTPYSAQVFGARLTRQFASLEEAQDAAVRLARVELENASKAIAS